MLCAQVLTFTGCQTATILFNAIVLLCQFSDTCIQSGNARRGLISAHSASFNYSSSVYWLSESPPGVERSPTVRERMRLPLCRQFYFNCAGIHAYFIYARRASDRDHEIDPYASFVSFSFRSQLSETVSFGRIRHQFGAQWHSDSAEFIIFHARASRVAGE